LTASKAGGDGLPYKDPFIWIALPAQKIVFTVSLVLMLALMIVLYVAGLPLQTKAAPAGIISYEFAGSLDNAQAMIESWGAEGRTAAALNLGLDYLYLVCYGLALGLGCMLISRGFFKRSRFLFQMGIILAWAQAGAALADAVENLALLQVLFGSAEAAWPVLAAVCASLKFLAVSAGVLYILVGLMLRAVIKVVGKNH
jgi:hypothetical protein